jgi:hypothetical protein
MHFTCFQDTENQDYDFIFKHIIPAQLTHFNMYTESIKMLMAILNMLLEYLYDEGKR